MPHLRILLAVAAAALAALPAAAQFRLPPMGGVQGPQQPGAAPRPAQPALKGPQLVDRIVAVVNKEVITQRDLNERMNIVVGQLRRQNTPLPPQDVLERQVLERMITDRIQVQFAQETGLRVEDAQVDRTVSMIAEQNRLSMPEFRAALEREGVSYMRFRDDIRNEITIGRLREREVDAKIQISESEIDNFLEGSVAGEQKAVQYNLAHILVRVPDNASPDQIAARQRRAQEAEQRLRGGGDFAQVAVSFSDAPDALGGGNMGWRESDRLPEIFVAALAKMKPGDVSEVLRSPAGFHIVKLVDRRGGSIASAMVPQTRVRHILARVNEIVSESEARRKMGVLRQRIVDGASFAEVAKLNSDDPGSAQRGGELGWVMPGDLVPEFERAMNELKIGEISQPVRTQFGVHLIQVEERRTADLPGDRKRLEARKVLRDRRADEAYQEWLRQLRDRTFVEYRLDER
jgi:peptidyl-prolyl cis-trans isomerase SurA